MRKQVQVPLQNFGAAVGNRGNDAAPPPESRPPSRVVPGSEVREYVGPGHGMFIELCGRAQRGDKLCRVDYCPRCADVTPHEYLCLQPAGPRVWGYHCTRCRMEGT